jgi:hypothetical protein
MPMKLSAIVAVMLVLANVGGAPLQAVLPPLAPPQYAADGPLDLCGGDYAIAVKPDESVHVIGDIIRVISNERIVVIKYDGFGTDRFDFGRPSRVALRGGTAYVARFGFTTPDSGRTLAYARKGLENADRRYAILTADQDQLELIIGSDAFNGSDDDYALFSGILVKSKVKPDDCIELSRALVDRNYSAAREKQRYMADVYPAVPENGPAYHCISGIGFSVKPGEHVRRPWRPLRAESPVLIESDGHFIRIEGSDWRAQKADPQAANEHPLGMLQKSSITYYPSRGTGPPYAPEGVREAGSWNIKLGSNSYRGIQISFKASEGTSAGFRFLERLEFVKPDDERCRR